MLLLKRYIGEGVFIRPTHDFCSRDIQVMGPWQLASWVYDRPLFRHGRNHAGEGLLTHIYFIGVF